MLFTLTLENVADWPLFVPHFGSGVFAQENEIGALVDVGRVFGSQALTLPIRRREQVFVLLKRHSPLVLRVYLVQLVVLVNVSLQVLP